MLQTSSVLARLRNDFPNITFKKDSNFLWSPENQTIHYSDSQNDALLIHEVAHALLDHKNYTRDINLLKMERDAWTYASTNLADRYQVVISPSVIDEMLDSYRNWMHERSLCPNCQSTGVQTARKTYTCVACESKWYVNEARSCELRRHLIK